MANVVTLTFAGEDKPLTDSFNRVGGSAKKMGDDVGSSAKALGEHANGLEKVGGSADNAERNIIGVHDVIDGTATIMQGPGKQGIVAYLQGWADLAGGIAPMAEYLAQTKVATLAQAAAGKVAAAGSKVWAAGQWVLNSAFLASPITWIVVGIVALIAVIVLIAKKTDWFSKAWRASWGWIKTAASNTWDFLKKIPGWIGTAFSKVGSYILAPYKAAFNGIARAWNATIGQLSWSVPSWVPFIGGNSISVPHLPTFHAGGTVGGVVGTPQVALLQAGEKVSSIASSGDDRPIPLGSDGTRLGDALVTLIAETVARKGGRAARLGIATL
jgi:phage-related protein